MAENVETPASYADRAQAIGLTQLGIEGLDIAIAAAARLHRQQVAVSPLIASLQECASHFREIAKYLAKS